MPQEFIVTSVTKSTSQDTPEHTVIRYQVGTRKFMLTLADHNQIDEDDLNSAQKTVEEHLKYCALHGLSYFDQGMNYAEDVRERTETRLRDLGLLEAHSIEEVIFKNLERASTAGTKIHLDDQPSLDELAKVRALDLIDEVIASGDYLSEAGYLARIVYHLDVDRNDFMIGVLWSEMNWFLNHERSALYGEKFSKSANTAPATQARQRRANEDVRAIISIAKRIDRAPYLTRDGKVKIRPLAKAVKETLDLGATPRNCGLRKIEKVLREKFKK
ncbi:MAG: hypothetical protein HRU33_09400 [Rhodobacteraceae bacterium]|nr:hypothetical protein [Paracoccaceae bacterium]